MDDENRSHDDAHDSVPDSDGTPKVNMEPFDSPDKQWDAHPKNPWNWGPRKKGLQLAMISSAALLASIGTSINSPAHAELQIDFNVSSTVALLPLCLYVLALAFGPVVGGPVSEIYGRYPVFLVTLPLGTIFTIGAGFTSNFGALCFLRFISGFCWGPVFAVAVGSLADVWSPATRGPMTALFILAAFMGPGLGPIIGAFVVDGKGWRWTQWTLVFMAIPVLILVALNEETFPPVLRKRLGISTPEVERPVKSRLHDFLIISLLRPLRMLFTEPIVAFICLFTAVNFGTLFSFFAGVPYTFITVYQFSPTEIGLVFLSIVIGCILGMVTVVICEGAFYKKAVARYPEHKVPPEQRLYAAMIGSIGLPASLFWFAWSAQSHISWASPAASIILFAWGQLTFFISTAQYLTDAYHGSVVASAGSANTLARYGFAAVFPLFTIQMYEQLGVQWATSLLGFIALALMPVPFMLFKFGKQIRARSRFETFQDA